MSNRARKYVGGDISSVKVSTEREKQASTIDSTPIILTIPIRKGYQQTISTKWVESGFYIGEIYPKKPYTLIATIQIN